jgi:dTDP-4-amino-4,6-dideoxygalactose transaminase
MDTKPAVLGGGRAFGAKVNFVRPVLPQLDVLGPGVKGCLESGMVTKGQHLREFETALAEHLGVKHAVCVSSCTTGLMLAYRCFGLTGDVVIPSFTFMATASSLVWAGLRPVYADVDVETTNLNPAARGRPRSTA